MEKKYYNNSIYILSNEDFREEDAWNELSEEETEKAEFIEFDYAVASYNNFKNCAIFHIN